MIDGTPAEPQLPPRVPTHSISFCEAQGKSPMLLCSYFNSVHCLELHRQSLQDTNFSSPLGPMPSAALQRLSQLMGLGSLLSCTPGLTSVLQVEKCLPFSLPPFSGAAPQRSGVSPSGSAVVPSPFPPSLALAHTAWWLDQAKTLRKLCAQAKAAS